MIIHLLIAIVIVHMNTFVHSLGKQWLREPVILQQQSSTRSKLFVNTSSRFLFTSILQSWCWNISLDICVPWKVSNEDKRAKYQREKWQSRSQFIMIFLISGEPCVDHNKKDGVCMRISECYSLSLVHDLYMLQRDYLRHELLETDIISCNRTNSKRQLVVCCKDGQVQSKSIVLPTGKACATPKSNTSMYSSLTGVCSGKKVT